MSRPFHAARIGAVERAAKEQLRILIDAPDDVVAAHRAVGQFCVLRLASGKESYYALATRPAERRIEFLARAAKGAEVASVGRGDDVSISEPIGRGFDLDRARAGDVLLVATGTGIAPIRAAVAELVASPAPRALALYYGVRGPEWVAFDADLRAWASRGVEVVLHASDDPAAGDAAVRAFATARARPGAHIVAAGHDAVIAALRDVSAATGMGADGVLTNL